MQVLIELLGHHFPTLGSMPPKVKIKKLAVKWQISHIKFSLLHHTQKIKLFIEREREEGKEKESEMARNNKKERGERERERANRELRRDMAPSQPIV